MMDEMDAVVPSDYELRNADGNKLFCRKWAPDKPRALVFICHGYSEHLGYYEDISKDFYSANYLVAGHDHVGHGQSEGTRVLVSSISVYVRDMFMHTDILKQEYPDLPIFLLSHSMGSTIGLKAGFIKSQYFKGMVLIAPCVALDPEVATPLKKILSRVLGTLIPQFPVAPIELDLVTRNLEMRKKLADDPLRFNGFAKAGWANAMLGALEEIEKGSTAISCPYIILHGSADKICTLEGSRTLLERSSSSDKTLKVYPDAFHNLLTELPEVAAATRKDALDWVEARTF